MALPELKVRITADPTQAVAGLDKVQREIVQTGQASTRTQAQVSSMGSAMTRLGNISGQTRARIQNTSYQISDLVVQLQSGTKASTAFAQQVPQLAAGFGALGAVIGVLAGIGIPALAVAFAALRGEVQSTEVDITGAFSDLIPEVPLFGHPLQGQRFDCGHLSGMLEATLFLAQKRPDLKHFMNRKVG